MSQDRVNSMMIGIFYLIAFAAAVIAVILYDPIMAGDWYLIVEDGLRNSVLAGTIFDLLLMVSAIGTAVFLAPYLSHTNKQLAFAYFGFRFMEAVFIGLGIVSVLVLITLSDAYASGLVNDTSHLLVNGFAWQGVHRWIMILGPNFMLGINTFIYANLLRRSKLVPKWIGYFGMVTAVLVLVAGFLDMFSIIDPWSPLKGLISLPIGVFEVTLALYLIFKGFRSEGLVLTRKNSL